MPATHFSDCPAVGEVLISDCLTKCVRGQRCLTLPTLKLISSERSWTGVPSTTQLMNGTLMEYLKITNDYCISIQGKSFAISGTKKHSRLEFNIDDEVCICEKRYTAEDCTGTPDYFDKVEGVLWDYKTSGSYKVAQALGLVGEKIDDPTGAVYKSSGKWGKAGTPKQVSVFRVDPAAVNCFDWEMQLNRYRLFIESDGYKVNEMVIEAIPRDGGTHVAKGRGITENFYRIPIKRIDDNVVMEYFNRKSEALKEALKLDFRPRPCSDEECWNGRRCESYCEVAHICKQGE